jgi:coenzyme F420-reducing hydrogenase delta subunit
MVSEQVIRVPLTELATLRVRCLNPQCGGLVEATVERFAQVFAQGYRCPVCGVRFGANQADPDHLRALVKAMEELKRDSERVEIEFVVSEGKQA